MPKKILRAAIAVFVFAAASSSLAAAALLFTDAGASAAVRFLAGRYGAPYGDIRIGSVEGRLTGTVIARGVRIEGLKGLPPGSALYARTVSVSALDGRRFRPHVRVRGIHLRAPGTAERVSVRAVDGNPLGRVTATDVFAAGLKGLPPEATLKIQSLEAESPFRAADVRVVTNGRLSLGASDPALFYGTLGKKAMDVRLYCRSLDLADVLRVYGKGKLRFVTGSVENLEARVTGRPDAPEARGRFRLKAVKYGRFRLVHGFGSFAFSPRKENGRWTAPGRLELRRGKVRVMKTSLTLDGATAELFGDGRLPRFDVTARSRIEDVDVTLRLRGTADKPDLSLTSDPPLPQERLLIMVATGKAWKGTAQAMREGRVSMTAAREFLDFFVLGGSGRGLADVLGLKDLTLLYTEDMRGVEVRKGVTRDVDAIYGIETPQAGREDLAVKQRLGAEMRVGRDASVSVEGQKEAPSEAAVGADNPGAVGSESVKVEYKRKF